MKSRTSTIPLYWQAVHVAAKFVRADSAYKTDNRSAYDALATHLRGNFSPWFKKDICYLVFFNVR